MMRLIPTILAMVLCATSALAQPYIGWVQRFNGTGNSEDRPAAVAVDTQGNVYVTGFAYYGTTTRHDYTTIKYDSLGNQLWVARYDGPASLSDTASALAVDDDGNVYVTGASPGSGTGLDFATIKYLPNGDTAWVRRYNGPGNLDDGANAIVIDVNGNVYVTGSSGGAGTGADYATIKYDSNGNQQWVVRYNGPASGPDRAFSLALDYNSNVFITGHSFDFGANNADFATIKYDSLGNQLWVARYDGPGNYVDMNPVLAIDGLNNVIVTGTSAQNNSGGINFDFATVKYDQQGNQLWAARYDGPFKIGDEATGIAVDSGSNIFVTGISIDSVTSYDFTVIKYYSTGDTAWIRTFNGPANSGDGAYAAAVDISGNVYVTGGANAGDPQSPNSDYTTIKYFPNGNTAWVRTYNGLGNGDDRAFAIAIDKIGNSYVTGVSEARRFVSFTSDFLTIKYSATSVLKGDLDQNGVLTLNDAVLLLNCVFFGNGYCPPAFADLNCDAFLTPSDIVILLNIFFLQTPSPC